MKYLDIRTYGNVEASELKSDMKSFWKRFGSRENDPICNMY